MTTCNNCGKPIATSAKVCPNCGAKNKKPIYKRAWFIAIVVLIVLGAIGTALGNNNSQSSSQDGNKEVASVNTQAPEAAPAEAPKEYTAYDASQLFDDLEQNALKASDTYKNQYVEISGEISNIDSGGKYFSIKDSSGRISLAGIRCDLTNDDQKNVIKELSTGSKVSVKGKVKEVGEVLGYSIDVDEVVAK